MRRPVGVSGRGEWATAAGCRAAAFDAAEWGWAFRIVCGLVRFVGQTIELPAVVPAAAAQALVEDAQHGGVAASRRPPGYRTKPRSALLATALLGFAGRVLAAGSDDELVEVMRPFGVAVVAGTGPAGCKVLWRWRMPAVREHGGAHDAVLALDRPGMLTDAYSLHEFAAGSRLEIGPFHAATQLLPHWVPNAGLRLTAGDRVLAYTGDAGPGPDVVRLARDADLLLAEATYVDQVPHHSRRHLTSARQAGQQATQAEAGRLLLTHLWPGTRPASAQAAAGEAYDGKVGVAVAGLVVDIS